MSLHSEHPDPVLRVLHDMGTAVKRLTVATVVLYLLLTVALGSGLYLLNERAEDTRALVHEFGTDRVENRARYKRSDVLLCREIEALKRQNREDAQETFDNLGRTLRILRLDRTPEIEEVALENLTADLLRNTARAGGCGDLPSVGAGG